MRYGITQDGTQQLTAERAISGGGGDSGGDTPQKRTAGWLPEKEGIVYNSVRRGYDAYGSFLPPTGTREKSKKFPEYTIYIRPQQAAFLVGDFTVQTDHQTHQVYQYCTRYVYR